jgi:hypothetical protein
VSPEKDELLPHSFGIGVASPGCGQILHAEIQGEKGGVDLLSENDSSALHLPGRPGIQSENRQRRIVLETGMFTFRVGRLASRDEKKLLPCEAAAPQKQPGIETPPPEKGHHIVLAIAPGKTCQCVHHRQIVPVETKEASEISAVEPAGTTGCRTAPEGISASRTFREIRQQNSCKMLAAGGFFEFL